MDDNDKNREARLCPIIGGLVGGSVSAFIFFCIDVNIYFSQQRYPEPSIVGHAGAIAIGVAAGWWVGAWIAMMPDNPNTVGSGKLRRRWYQFSLRTLLIGVALLAIAFGYASYRARAARELMAERKAVLAAVKRLGGSYSGFQETPYEFRSDPDAYLSRLEVKLYAFSIPAETPRDTIRRIRSTFPDTTIFGFTAPASDGWGGRFIMIPAYDDKR